MNERIKIDITTGSFLRFFVILGLLYLIILVKDALILLFIAAILVAAFLPIINRWSKKIGKSLSILILVLIMVGIIAGFISLIIPPLADQSKQLVNGLPNLLKNSSLISNHMPSVEKGINSVAQSFGQITGGFITITTSILNTVVAFFTVLVLTIYLLIDEQVITRFLSTVIPNSKKENVNDLISKISTKIGEWLRGQLLLCLIIGIISYIGLSIIGVKYALVLAVISGLLEILPIVGPIVSGGLAALVGLSISPLTALIVIIFYILLQQIENNLIVPKIMSKAVGLPPAIIIIAILIGGKLLGILGALLAVPMVAIVFVIFQEWTTIRKIFSKYEE